MIKRSRAEWQSLIDEQVASGLNAAEFCGRNQLNPKYFSLRRRELSQRASAFIELAPQAVAASNVTVRVFEITAPLADLESVIATLRWPCSGFRICCRYIYTVMQWISERRQTVCRWLSSRSWAWIHFMKASMCFAIGRGIGWRFYIGIKRVLYFGTSALKRISLSGRAMMKTSWLMSMNRVFVDCCRVCRFDLWNRINHWITSCWVKESWLGLV